MRASTSLIVFTVIVALAVGIAFYVYALSPSDKEAVAMTEPAPIEAVVQSVEVMPHERREGMRRVRVSVRSVDGKLQETITEWVPVVLLGRLTVGASVQLIVDPVLHHLTIGL